MKEKSEVDHLFEVMEKVLRRVVYGEQGMLTNTDFKDFDRAREAWSKRQCKRRGCQHRADTCSFASPGIQWLTSLGWVDLCEFLNREHSPKTINALDTKWLRRPGHFNP